MVRGQQEDVLAVRRAVEGHAPERSSGEIEGTVRLLGKALGQAGVTPAGRVHGREGEPGAGADPSPRPAGACADGGAKRWMARREGGEAAGERRGVERAAYPRRAEEMVGRR